jgi:HK97 gp10 family phage protein
MRTKVTWDNLKGFGYLRRAQMALIRQGLLIERDIKMSMKKQGGGREYKVSKTGRPHHASAAGEVPAVLTGRLRASITTCWSGGQRPVPDTAPTSPDAGPEDAVGVPGGSDRDFRVVVGTNVDYAVFLELGTSKMSPRPFMRPAFERHRANVEKNIGAIALQIPIETATTTAMEIGGEFGTD